MQLIHTHRLGAGGGVELVCVRQEGSSGLCLLAELSEVFKELQGFSAGGHKEGLYT